MHGTRCAIIASLLLLLAVPALAGTPKFEIDCGKGVTLPYADETTGLLQQLRDAGCTVTQDTKELKMTTWDDVTEQCSVHANMDQESPNVESGRPIVGLFGITLPGTGTYRLVKRDGAFRMEKKRAP